MKHKILCVHCRTHLYDYAGEFSGRFDGERFSPIGLAPIPTAGAPCVCWKCNQPWYYLRENGAIVVRTNHGLKPSPPSKSVTVPLLQFNSTPTVNDEYIDPLQEERNRVNRERREG